MRPLRKIKNYICFIVIAALAASLCCACGTEEVKGDKFLVYYLDSEGDDITYKQTYIEDSNLLSSAELVELLLDKMLMDDESDGGYVSAFPENVSIKNYDISGNLIAFDFSREYKELSNVNELILRVATVLTIIQVPDITQVIFTIEGEPLTNSDGRVVGTMSADDFVNVLLTEEGMLKQETDITLYFTEETGTRLVPAMYHFTISNSNTSKEEYVLAQLIKGPAIDSTYRTISSDVELISVTTTDYVCYVNFGSNFLEQDQPVSDDILIYSIVNSLCGLPNVNSVQFLIEGSSEAVLHTVTDLSRPFSRNMTLVD